MKKRILFILLMLMVFGLIGCSKQTTTTSSDALIPADQNSLLSSLSEAIKNVFD